ncbi:MAG: hypothetical protein HOB05_02220 [Bacteroidetes bacterium]|nr:hypothetical protein [Bacteroidota bacterium]
MFAKVFFYFFLSPFIPRRTFRHFLSEENKKQIVLISIVCGILLVFVVFIISTSALDYQDINSRLANLAGFLLGLLFRNLWFVYLIVLLVNKLKLAHINWPESLAIVSFALLPIAIGQILKPIDSQWATIIRLCFTIWNALIIVLGLSVLKQINIWKALFLVTGISLTLAVINSAFFGKKI